LQLRKKRVVVVSTTSQMVCWFKRKLLNRLPLLLLCGILICAGLVVESGAQQQDLSSGPFSPAQNFVYLFGPNGAFLKIATEDNTLAAYWMLSRTEGASAYLAPCRDGHAADPGCGMLFGRLQIDDRTGRAYGVFAARKGSKQPDTDIEYAGYQVLVLQLPEMKIVASLPISQTQLEPPTLLLTPDGKRFFLRYRDRSAEAKITEPTIVSIVDVYDANTLKGLSTMRESVVIKDVRMLKAVMNLGFGDKAYFDTDGNVIFDNLTATTIAGASMRRQYINPLEGLSAEQRDRLKAFEKIDAPTQRPWLDFVAGDSAAGKTVVRVANSSFTEAAYWTVDLRTGQDSPIIIAPFGIDHLTPDGRLLLIQEAKLAESADKSAREIQAGPNFWLYDVSTGKQVARFENTVLSGPFSRNRLICISPSGKRAFFANERKTQIVSLPDGNNLAALETQSLEASASACTFSGR
jgi:hypothetical protein